MTLAKDSTDRLAMLAHGGVQADADYVLRTRTLTQQLAAASADVVANYCLFYNNSAFDFRLKRVMFVPVGALTADGTDYLTLDLKYGDTAAANLSAALATQVSTASVSWVADTAIVLAGITDADVVPAGKYLWLIQDSPGSGVARPLTFWQVDGEYV